MTREEAHKALKIGGNVAVIQTILSVVLIWYAMSQNIQSGRLADFNDPWTFADSIILLICAFGMFKKSRLAAVVALLLMVINIIYTASYSFTGTGIIVGLGIAYVYFRAVRGAFTLRRIRKAENPDLKGMSRWIVVPLSIVALGLSILVAIGLMMETGVIPSASVERGVTLETSVRDDLVDFGILFPDERVEQYFFLGLLSPYAEGILLTDRAVVYFFQLENQDFEIWEMTFDQISSVELVVQGGFLTNSEYLFNGYEPDNWMQLPLSPEEGGDIRFVTAVRARIGG